MACPIKASKFQPPGSAHRSCCCLESQGLILGLYWGYIGIMEKIETTMLYWGYSGVQILQGICWGYADITGFRVKGYIGIIENRGYIGLYAIGDIENW